MFRFSIRELVLLTLVVGLGVGWWVDNRLTASHRVGPPKWHGMLRAVVEDLQARPTLQIEKSKRLSIGVMTEGGTWYWHNSNYQESD